MGYLFLFLTIWPALLLASPAEEPEETTIPILETTQQLFGARVNTVANRLDLFFADQRADDELARSRIRLRQRYEVRERALMQDDFQIRFNIKLPNLEEKFKFKMEKKQDEKTKKETIKKEAIKDALGNDLDTSWQYRADVGVNASVPPRVFFRNRLRKNWQTGGLIHRFVEEVSWFSDRDWEQNTSVDTDFIISRETLFRFNNASDWKMTRKDFTTSHGPTVRQRLSDNDAVSYGVGMSTVVDNGVWYVTGYRIATTYRRNLYKQWIYVDLTPGLDFPKQWSFRRTPFVAMQLEVLLGGY
jgi:hypothetical protein